ncbi:MAG TPA: Cof-type HAD-IIB family hydrolase [Acetobacteraceae bacterium]|nr:Cof-type HAD-IIB family hydrolase [Acetobacteraceae bacterium]
MNPPADIRLLLADVDGTLVTQEKVLTEAAIAAAGELRAQGVTLALTSGRPPRGMQMLVAPLALTGAIAGFNGGVFVNPDLSVIDSHVLDPKVAKQALAVIADHGLDGWLYTVDDWLVTAPEAPHVAREAWTVKFEPHVVGSFTDAQFTQAVKIVGVSDDHARVAACERDMQAALGAQASAARSQPYYLDVTHPQANKGAVVDRLSKLLDIPRGQIATIGDMPNDVLMFRRSGFSFAMGNADDEVKAAANATVASNEQEGFAQAVRSLLAAQAGRKRA